MTVEGEAPILVNQVRIAELVGCSKVTIGNWHRDGLPIHRRGEGSNGANAYDVGEVFRWIRARDQAQAEQAIARAKATRTPDAIRARRWTAEAKLRELDVAAREGSMVSTSAVSTRWERIATAVRNAILGLPTRARQRLPHLTASDVAAIDALVRECLESLADDAGRRS